MTRLHRLRCVATAALGFALIAAAAAPSFAQDRPAEAKPKDAPAGSVETRKHPRPNNRAPQDLEFLFGALKAAPDATSAKAVETRIQALWLASGSDTADLLMSRVKSAAEAKDAKLAIRLLDSIVEIKPDFVEAWNRRATLYFMEKNFSAAIQDIRQVLAREPRHFGALVGLGLIMQELGEDERALQLFRRAVDVHPHLPRVPDLIKDLTTKVDGREI
jgi:tetratricopeptide (TPR) repeat protein